MGRKFILMGLLALTSSASASATQTDGQAVVSHASLVREVTESASAGRLDVARTRKLIQIILFDGNSDPQEQDLVAELRRPEGTAVSVTLPSGQIVQLPAPDAGGRALLELFVQPPDPSMLWLKDGDSMVKLAEIASWSSLANRQIRDFVANRLHEDWKGGATISNNYQPLRGTLERAWSLIKDLEPESRRRAAGLLYSSMKDVDRARNDSLPDFIYSWLNPAGEFVRKGGQ